MLHLETVSCIVPSIKEWIDFIGLLLSDPFACNKHSFLCNSHLNQHFILHTICYIFEYIEYIWTNYTIDLN